MNKNLYLNVIVTLIFGTFLILGIVIVNALDHHRFAMEQLTLEVRKLESRLSSGIVRPQASPRMEPGRTAETALAANAAYFDPQATDGGKLVRAFAADVGNLNSILTNDAYVSMIWSQVTDSLAERDYRDTGDGEYAPMLAESWSFSPDQTRCEMPRSRIAPSVTEKRMTSPVAAMSTDPSLDNRAMRCP